MSIFQRTAFQRTAPLLLLPLAAHLASAQPPTAPSTIKKPATQPVFVPPAPIPDPPQMSAAELQTLTGGPTLVTLSGQDLPVKEALQSLLEAAGMKVSRFRPAPEEAKPLSFAWQKTPFWDAALELETHTGGYWNTFFGDGLSLTTQPFPGFAREMFGFSAGPSQPQPSLRGRTAAQTPFVRLIANSLSRTTTRGTRLSEIEGEAPAGGFEAPPDRIQLGLTAFFDPKIKVRSVELRGVQFQPAPPAALQPERPNMGGIRYSSGRNANIVNSQIITIPPTFATGSRIARLSGVLHSVVESQVETWKIADLGAAPKSTRTLGGVEYSFEPLDQRENELNFRLKQPGARGNDFAQFESLRVRDAQGREVPGGPRRLEGQQADFNFRLGEANPGPYSLEWPIATQTRSLDVPFELRDVVVP